MTGLHKSEIKGWIIFGCILPFVLMILGIWGLYLFLHDIGKKLLIKAGLVKPKYPYPFH